MFDYVPDVFRAQYADTEDEADRWYTDPDNNKRPPELLPRDEVARAINSEVKAGRGSPHGGVFLDIASRLPEDEILRRLPSMHHQFKELADVDITAEAMEVGPTCHYVMGGVEVEADTAAAPTCPGCSRPARSPAACTARTGSAATRCPTCWCSAGGPATARPRTSRRWAATTRRSPTTQVDAAPRRRWPRWSAGGENPYEVHQELQQTMNDLVGIIRKASEVAGGAGAAREAQGARPATSRRRRPGVQPGLAPRARPAQHARVPSAWRGRR